MLADGGAPAVLALAPPSVVLADGGAPSVLALAPPSVVLADGGAPAVLASAPLSVVRADGGAPAVLAFAPPSVVLADGGASSFHAPAPPSAVSADGGAPAVLADSPVCADAAAPAVHALTLASAVRAFRLRLRRPGPLLPPLRLRLLPYPPFPACRFPLALALSALAPLLAKLLAEPRGQELFTRGLGHLQADGLADARCGGRGAMPSLGGRWSARGTSRVGGTAGLSCLSEARSRRRRRRLSTLWSRDTWP